MVCFYGVKEHFMFYIVIIQSTGESLLFLATASMTNNCKTEECQKNSCVMPTEERELHNNGLSEDTSTVLRDGGIDGNEIRKNSRNIGKFAETRVHIVVSSNQ